MKAPELLESARPVRAKVFVCLAAAIFAGSYFLARHTDALVDSFLRQALVTAALTIAVPVLYGVLIARPRRQSAIPWLVAFLVATVAANVVLPNAQQSALRYVEGVLVVSETALLILVVLRLRRLYRLYKEEGADPENYGFPVRLTAAATRALGNPTAARLFAGEVATLYYGLLFPVIPSAVPRDAHSFSAYRSGYRTLFIAISAIAVIELVGVHLVLDHLFGAVTAWIVTGLSIYGFLFLLADFVAMVKCPSIVHRGRFLFRLGLRWSATIPLDKIREVRPLTFRTDTTGMLQCAVQRHTANLVMHFTDPITVYGPFGIRRSGDSMVLNVDEPQTLIAALRAAAAVSDRARTA